MGQYQVEDQLEYSENHHLTFTKFNFSCHFSRLQTLLKITSADQPHIRILSSPESGQTTRDIHKIKNRANFRKSFNDGRFQILLNQNQHRQSAESADSPLMEIKEATTRNSETAYSCRFYQVVWFWPLWGYQIELKLLMDYDRQQLVTEMTLLTGIVTASPVIAIGGVVNFFTIKNQHQWPVTESKVAGGATQAMNNRNTKNAVNPLLRH